MIFNEIVSFCISLRRDYVILLTYQFSGHFMTGNWRYPHYKPSYIHLHGREEVIMQISQKIFNEIPPLVN
jgi:hypothetical protein